MGNEKRAAPLLVVHRLIRLLPKVLRGLTQI
jgi:hypothetical protein